MSDVVIRRAKPDDAPALAAMRWQFKAEEGSDEVPQEEGEFVAECEGWLRARMTGPWRAWLAEVGGRPCGHVCVCLVEKVPSPYPDSEALGYVTNFYVTPEQRNRGLGRASSTLVQRGAGRAVRNVVGGLLGTADTAAGNNPMAAVLAVPGTDFNTRPVEHARSVGTAAQGRRFHFCRARPVNRSWTGWSRAQRVTTVSCLVVAMTWKTSACSSSDRQPVLKP
ncbi:acetyltransferase [Streptomyces noursei]|nr:acetyltransferase [Streptomyces noursei]